MDASPLRLFLRLVRPLYLLVGALMYALGAGIARFVGVNIDIPILVLGLAWVLLLQVSVHFLNDYFDETLGREIQRRNPFFGHTAALGPGKLPRATALWAALGTLAVTASSTVFLIRSGRLTPSVTLILVFLSLGALLYTIPPARLASTGYGELVISILMANLVPAFGLLLQTGEFHRLLAMTTFPLLALHLVMILAFEFVDFATDIKYEAPTLLVKMGWRPGMTLHNLLILAAFLLVGLAATFGLPRVMVVPALIPVPLGLLEIWLMSRIGAGERPNWRALIITSVSLFVSMAYLMTFAYWTR